MRKITLELPKGRLELHLKLIKRRKPLVVEPLLPSPKLVKRKYRKGSFIGKLVRHLSEHKSTRKVMVANMAAFVVMSAYMPLAQAQTTIKTDVAPIAAPSEAVIQAQNTLITQKAIQTPLENGRLNQRYSRFHPGLDLGAPIGTPIKAIKAGGVIEAGYAVGGYGNTVVVDHGSGLTSRYAHLSKIEVKAGDAVTTSSTIGTVGMTGRSTGPHLHLEVRQAGIAINPLTVIGK